MKNKMDLNVVAETKEEKKIEEYINILNNSEEVHDFLQLMKDEAKKRNIYKFRSRIKNVNSAIRTHRINKKGLAEVRDYIGASFITNTEDEIYPIINFLKEKLPNGDYVDFVAEETIYSPLVYIKWVPPLGYNILSKEPMIANHESVPIEIRVCSKDGYISEQSAYYSIQKNDKTGLTRDEISNLRNVAQHVTYKLSLLNTRNFVESEKEKQHNELQDILKRNEAIILKNKELITDAILDFGRLTYKCEHDEEFSADEAILSQEEIDKIDAKIKNKFYEYLGDIEKFDETVSEKVQNALNEMKKIEYAEMKK